MSDLITDAILAGIVTISADAIICVDESQKIIFFNEGAARVFGYSSDEAIGMPLELLVPERFRHTHSSQVENFGRSRIRARRMGERRQISGVRKNGQEFPAEAAIAHLGSDGQRVYSVVLRDVTERRRAHEIQTFLAEAGETLASSLGAEATLQNVARLSVPQLADACIVYLYDGGVFRGATVAHMNEARAAELERSSNDNPIDVAGNHPVADAIRTRSTVVVANSANGVGGAPNRLRELAGIFDQPPTAAIIVPLIAREHLLGVLSFYREHGDYDASDLFLAEEIARRAAIAIDNSRLHEQVRSGIRARDDMIGIVSHDLRNPVNAVKMLTGVMLNRDDASALQADMREYAGVIRQAAEQMDSLIRDLLDVTKVEAGRLTVDARVSDTEELISDALRTLSPLVEGKGMKLRLDAADDLPPVRADSERITQAFSNLVGNAIKFAPARSDIIVRVTILDTEVLFSVTDSGQGMTPDQLSHAFDRFWQSSRTDREGAGLGLAITKGIIDAHGGRIWAESAPGAGSTFYFTLPIVHES